MSTRSPRNDDSLRINSVAFNVSKVHLYGFAVYQALGLVNAGRLSGKDPRLLNTVRNQNESICPGPHLSARPGAGTMLIA